MGEFGAADEYEPTETRRFVSGKYVRQGGREDESSEPLRLADQMRLGDRDGGVFRLARLLYGDVAELERAWLAALAPRLPNAALVCEAVEPVLGALSRQELDGAELVVVELMADVREQGGTLADALDIVRELEHAMRPFAPQERFREPRGALARYLGCVAVREYAAPAPVEASRSGMRMHPSVPPQVAATPLRDLIGHSAGIRQVIEQVHSVARAPGPVLIVGESGTGKELVAKSLHELGASAAAPRIAVNCAALPLELVESELFGHEKGAFTGSRGNAPGLMRAADDGVLFLDEITELPLSVQPKLLRALEQRSVRPVGGTREVPMRARVVAATNRDPRLAVEQGVFRADLFFRLSAHCIFLPPLRERPGDVPLLVEHFLRQLREQYGHRVPQGFDAASMAILERYAWPGNVRELRNLVEHCCATSPGSFVKPADLPAHMTAAPRPGLYALHGEVGGFGGEERVRPLHEVEREHICKALRSSGGNKAKTARLLGLSRHQLYLRLERLSIDDY